MLNLKRYKGFALIRNDNSLEAQRLSAYCYSKDIPLKKVNKGTTCPFEYVPCGSVEWCLMSLGTVTPDYYPNWAKQYLNRKVWGGDKWILGRKLFVKPADRYKRFNGFVTHGTWSKKKKPPYYWSEVVKFINEWRYYISNGEVLCGEWYGGDDINTPEAPILDIEIPKDYCGALDFGTMFYYNGLYLVEAQHPFACGWYGKQEDDYLYFQWLIDGWEYMKWNIYLKK
jgi:hypothetical protein